MTTQSPSTWPVDLCFDKFSEYATVIEAASGCNEADTRLRAIDTLLFDVLGWDKTQVDAEKYSRPGYADYTFLHNSRKALILEAKRNDGQFLLPDHDYPDEPVAYGLIAHESSAAADALAQASQYAMRFATRFVGITNGSQWLITLTYVPDLPLDDRTIFVFESITAIRERFRTFHRCFGPAGVLGNLIAGDLATHRRTPAPQKLSSRLPIYPEPLDRNKLCNEIEYILGQFWNTTKEYEVEIDFLRDCYILTDAASGSQQLIQELLAQRREADQRQADAVGIKGNPSAIRSHVPNKPILIRGRVGHGKTTFLHYLRLIAAPIEFQKYMQITIDFLDRPDSPNQVADYIYDQIDSQILNQYGIDIRDAQFVRHALDSELRRFRNSTRGRRYAEGSAEFIDAELAFIESIERDRYKYLTHAIRHLRHSHHKSIAIFFDNLDRRTDHALQEQAFLSASAIARDWDVVVFICLRPGTYFRSVRDGLLDAVAPTVIEIVSPRASVLLRKRFRFAESLARGDRLAQGSPLPTAKPGMLELPTVASFFRCCAESFYHRKDTCHVFEAACNGDMRSLLRFVGEFVTAKHLDTRKIVVEFERDGRYSIPPHEALRALLYGDFWHYDPDKSIFINLFDIEHADPAEHFIRLLALTFLCRIPDGGMTHGYCRAGATTEYLLQLGFTQHAVSNTIDYLRSRNCIEDRDELELSLIRSEEVRITTLGRYHINELVRMFQYIDAVIVDVPIVDKDVRSHMGEARQIEDRLTRARLFVDYLDNSARTIDDPDARCTWQQISTELRADIDAASKNAERWRQRQDEAAESK